MSARRYALTVAAFALGACAWTVAASGHASAIAGDPAPRPIAGTLYPKASAFVAAYCGECHWQGGTNPKKKKALPALRLDTYENWRTHQAVLRGVIDKWHAEGKVMPPADAGARPSDAERRIILDWLALGSPNTASGT
jgi:uncharacterized membrane protein